jgi:hypothetical protein
MDYPSAFVVGRESREPTTECPQFPQNSMGLAFHTRIGRGFSRVWIDHDLPVLDKRLATTDHIQQHGLGVCHFEKDPVTGLSPLRWLTDVANTVQDGLDLHAFGGGHVRQCFIKGLGAVREMRPGEGYQTFKIAEADHVLIVTRCVQGEAPRSRATQSRVSPPGDISDSDDEPADGRRA